MLTNNTIYLVTCHVSDQSRGLYRMLQRLSLTSPHSVNYSTWQDAYILSCVNLYLHGKKLHFLCEVLHVTTCVHVYTCVEVKV